LVRTIDHPPEQGIVQGRQTPSRGQQEGTHRPATVRAQTSKYGPEGHHIGINVEMLKGMCRERNLQVTGAKYDLVLRILHCDNDSTPEGATLKRAATDVVSTVDAVSGEVVEKRVPKKRKKAAPSASRIYTRVEKKIEAVKQKKYQVRHCFCLLIYNYYYRAFFGLIYLNNECVFTSHRVIGAAKHTAPKCMISSQPS